MSNGGRKLTIPSPKLRLARLAVPLAALSAVEACQFTCFGGSTWISLDRGRKRLRDMKVGDVVKTYDVRTGELTLRPVVRVFSHGPRPVGQLKSRTGTGPGGVTSNHPIFVEQLGAFAPAENLDRNMQKRRGLHWDDRDLRAIDLEPYRPGPTGHFLPVFNLSIADTETYFADGLLVHNKSTTCESYYDYDYCYPTGGAGGLGGAGTGGTTTASGGQVTGSGGAASGGEAGSAGEAGAAGSAGSEP